METDWYEIHTSDVIVLSYKKQGFFKPFSADVEKIVL